MSPLGRMLLTQYADRIREQKRTIRYMQRELVLADTAAERGTLLWHHLRAPYCARLKAANAVLREMKAVVRQVIGWERAQEDTRHHTAETVPPRPRPILTFDHAEAETRLQELQRSKYLLAVVDKTGYYDITWPCGHLLHYRHVPLVAGSMQDPCQLCGVAAVVTEHHEHRPGETTCPDCQLVSMTMPMPNG